MLTGEAFPRNRLWWPISSELDVEKQDLRLKNED
jgi:hypothetical protein